ncbi:response regulator [Streptomyces virginiae]|uniref:response regulator n=1 Tax=Streptomyces virginiae TaxID=1961 RepID=UPI0005240C47|nr:response regulator transcription factor [Streptomyces virginiae]MCX4717438.1 response regulator transcription factor [Streptomyces virginiae]MCX5277288.1 response regulator transcription factor [Streptomyces virginiae]
MSVEPPRAIRVLLVDDQPLVRSGLRVLMADTADLTVVGEAGTGTDGVRLAAELRPDVVVMDIRMPGMDGIEATGLITAETQDVKVLVLTTFDEDDHVYGALRAGASGFAVKDMAVEEILAAIRVIAAGDALIAPGVTRRLIADFVRAPGPTAPEARAPRPVVGITEREREVLTLVGRGRSNGEIAEELFISAATAKSHVSRLFTKLAARDRVQLVIMAYEMGLVSTPR